MIAQTLTEIAQKHALLPLLSCLGLLLFVAFFTALLIRTAGKSQQTHYQSMGRMPLEREHKS